jgi:hypothetical protein
MELLIRSMPLLSLLVLPLGLHISARQVRIITMQCIKVILMSGFHACDVCALKVC